MLQVLRAIAGQLKPCSRSRRTSKTSTCFRGRAKLSLFYLFFVFLLLRNSPVRETGLLPRGARQGQGPHARGGIGWLIRISGPMAGALVPADS